MKPNFHRFPISGVQWLLFLTVFAISIFLLVAERGGDSLPCLAAEGKSHSPCAEMKAVTKERLGFSPALPGSIGAALCILVATFRMGTRHGSRSRRISSLLLRMLLGFAVIFAGFLIYEQSRASAWCVWCLLLSCMFGIAAGFEFSAARATRPPQGVLIAMLQAPVFALVIIAAIQVPAVSRATLRLELAQLMPEVIDKDVLADIAPCGYSEAHAKVEGFARWKTPFAHGSTTAPVHIAVFHDPFCALCRQLDVEMQPLLAKNRNHLRLISLPLDHVGDSLDAALFLHAVALARTDDDTVARIHDVLADLIGQSPRQTSRTALTALLASHGIDTTPLLARIESGEAGASLAKTKELFREAGGTKTPMVIVNGRVVAENVSSLRAPCLQKLILDAAGGNK